MRRSILPAACPPCLAIAALLALAPFGASATMLTPPSIISTYNLVAESNVTSTDDIEGSAVIGGNLSGGTFFNNRVPADPVVYLYGTQSGSTTLDTGTLIYNAITGSVNLNGGATKQQGGWPNLITDYTTPLNAYSQQLDVTAAQSGNTTTLNSGTLTFAATQATNGIAYFDYTTSALTTLFASASSVAFSLGAGVQTIVIDVDGSTFTEPGGVNMNGGAQQDVLFNFASATSLTVTGWETSVLAPDAATTTNSAFEGFLYTNTLQANGELHNLPPTSPLPPLAEVPEPASIFLIGAGLAAIGASRRTRRPAAAPR